MEMLTKEMVGDEDITKAEEPKYDYSDENLINLPPRVLEGYLAKKYGTDRYVRERSSVFEEASKNKISDRESILTGPELEALSLIFEEEIKQMKAKGGMAEQMEMFQEGGLKDEGGTVDPVSGNEVPPGSTQEEVRDDIPAQLSEGEFVFPADVVRYLGLEFLMKLRQRAKAGLQKMEEMGQMGNSDEATLPDDIPFTVDDIDMREETEEEMEMYQGGAVKAQAGMYVAPSIAPVRAGTTTTTQPFMTQPAVAQTNMAFQQPPVAQVNPNLTFANFLGPSAGGAPETEIRRYEHPDGRVRNITVVKATGLPLIPGELDKAKADGFDFKPEPLKEEVKVEPIKQQTSRVEPTTSGSDDPEDPPGAVDLTGNTFSYKSVFNMDKLDSTMKDYANMQTGLFSLYGAGERGLTGKINANDAILSSAKIELQNIRNRISEGYYLPNNFDLGNLSIYKNITDSSLGEKGVRDEVAKLLRQHNEDIRATITNPRTGETYTNEEFKKELEKYNISTKETKKNTNIRVNRNIGNIVRDLKNAKLEEVARYQQDTGVRDKTDPDSIKTAQQVAENMKNASNYFGEDAFQSSYDSSDPSDVADYSGSISDAGGSFVGDDPAFKQGGLAKKKKPKVKRMKKGGLASKK